MKPKWIIQHRINKLDLLKTVDKAHGIEMDIRYHENNLILEHDPFNHHNQKNQTLEEMIQNYKNEGPLILNVKTEGVEDKCIDLMKKHRVSNWFFLDLSPPYLIRYALKAKNQEIAGLSKKNLAIRFSEYEPIESALKFKGLCQWLWVDCFSDLPLNHEICEQLSRSFDLCIVSPELQGHSLDKIAEFKEKLPGITVTAVCTKRPDLWA